jgi:hypothetical protein
MTEVRCACGEVHVALRKKPILSVACYCDDCQEGSRRLEELPEAPTIREDDGATAYVLWRVDRVEFLAGEDRLERHRLTEESPTDRVVASCCQTALFLDFRKAHWVSMYRSRFEDPPDIEMGIQTRFMPRFEPGSTPFPTHSSFPLKFIARVVRARIAMVFGR